MPRRILSAACVLALAAVPAMAAAPAAPGAPDLCLAAADAAAARHGIPAQMMRAITLVETRRTVDGVTGPWPWTLNIGRTGYWHRTRTEALAHAEREMARGERSIDLGCFQLNHRWHGGNFSGPDEMLDPWLAADYAARFLGELHAETGDWMRAAGLYHSRTPAHSARYQGLVRRTLARLGVTPEGFASLDAVHPAAGEAPAAIDGHSGGRSRLLTVAARPGGPARAGRSTPALALPGAVALSLFAGSVRPLLLPAAVRP
jgi:hypothetical protein